MTSALLASLAVLVLPGLPAALALRLRPTVFAAALAPVSLLLVAAAAELGRLLGVPWTILSPLALGLGLGALLWPLGRRMEHRAAAAAGPDADGTGQASESTGSTGQASETTGGGVAGFFASGRGGALAVIGGLLVGGGFLLMRQLSIMGSITAVSQTYDNVFHLNATRHILRLQDASAWTVGGMTRLEGDEGYYPALWHQAASLVTQLGGRDDIILASNVLMLLVATVVWPLGLIALVRTTTSAGPLGWFLAGALSGVTAIFPLSLMSWGLLLPYFLSLALLPLVVAAVVHLVGLESSGPERLRPLQTVVLLIAGCGSAALAHPQGVFAGLVLGVPILLCAVAVRARDVRLRRPRPIAPLLRTTALTVAVLAFTAVVWILGRPPRSSAVWEPTASLAQAIGQVGSLSAHDSPAFLPMGVVMLAALIGVLLWTRSRWLLASWLVAAGFSVAARATSDGDLRYWLTGTWYSDTYRVTAILAVVAVPVLAVGFDAIGRRLARSWPVLRSLLGPVLTVALTAAVLAMHLLSPATAVNQQYMLDNWMYQVLLSDDERELLEQLPEVVPEDAIIATNAWNGSALAYAISDREVLNTFMGFEAEPEVHLLNAELDEAHRDPEVCEAMHEVGVDYALDFGPRELHDRTATYTGLDGISESGAAEVVLEVGEARLLRMLPCEGTDGSMIE